MENQFDAPEYLSESAIMIYNSVCEELQSQNKLNNIDKNLIAAYASEFDTYESLTIEIGSKRIFKSPNGYPVINPLVSLKNTALKNAKDIAQMIGIGPIPRIKLQNGEPHGVAPRTISKLKVLQLKSKAS